MNVHALVSAQDEMLHFNDKTLTIEEVFKSITSQLSYEFFYSDDNVNTGKTVDLEKSSLTLKEAMDKALEGRHEFTIVGKTIIISPVKSTAGRSQQAQTRRTLRGTVVDSDGKAMPGASIIIDGTQTGVTSDTQGNFMLQIPATGGTTLVASFLGYKTQRVAVGERAEIRIVMEQDALQVDDVIVTGYLGINRNTYVGAVTQIQAEDIQVAGESSIDQMLQGWIPGMSVVNTTGKVGGNPKIRIRGTSTIMGNQEPLWVVDGVIQTDPLPIPNNASPLSSEMESLRETAGNAISWLNPADIETITVLKDASATAIYGSQAANGVIVLTTKQATTPGLSINYSGNFTIGQKPGYNLYDMMNSQEAMRFQQEVWEDRDSYTQTVLPLGYAGLIQQLQKKEITLEQFQTEFRKMENQNTDWFKLLFRNSFSHSHNVSVTGVGDRVSTRFSLGMNQQFGDAKGNDMKSFTASSNTTFRFNERLMITLALNGSYRETNNFAFGVSPYDYAMNTSRVLPAYNDDGTLYYHPKFGTASHSIPNTDTYSYNILNELDNTGTKTTGATLMSSLNLDYKILNNLTFQSVLSYQIGSSKIKSHATEQSFYIANIRGYDYGGVIPNSAEQKASVLPFGGILQTEDAMTRNFSFRGSLVYAKNFNNLHDVTLNLGFEVTSKEQEGNTALRYGYLYYRGENFATVPKEWTPANGLTVNILDLHESMRAGTSIVNTIDNKVSEYFTAVYSYDHRYVLNFNARLDASNRFGQDDNKKFNPSWSIGAKWRIGNEPFMDWASSWYDMFDISLSYGWRGNAVQAVSPYLIARDGGLDTDFQQYTLKLVSLPYPDLGWEKTKDWNLGVAFSFLKGRLSADFNVYGKVSHVLSSRAVTPETGVENAYFGGSKITNNGYEFIISATPIRTQDFTWSLSFNASRVRNRIKEEKERTNTINDYITGNATVNGQAYQTFYAFAFDGLNDENGRPTFKNMGIDATDDYLQFLVKAGCLEPNVAGGLNMAFRYKNLHLRTNFALSFGAQSFLPSYFASSGAPTPEKNAPRYLLDRWRKPGDNTEIPSLPAGNRNAMMITLPTIDNTTYLSPYAMYNQSNGQVADTDFIRCRSISLQYYLPQRWSDAVNLKRISVSANLTNPFFIAFDSKWDGRDPETANWPARRTMTFSLSLNF